MTASDGEAVLQARLALLQRVGAIGLWSADWPVREIRLSPAATAVLGLAAGDGNARLALPDALALVTPDHHAALVAALGDAAALERPIDQILQLASTPSAPRWVRLRAEFVRGGSAPRLEGTLQDATAQVRAELALSDAVATQRVLRDSEARYARAVRGSSDGLWDWDVRSGREYMSPRWRELLGLPPAEPGDAEESFFGRIHADDAGTVRAAMQAHLQHGAPFDIELRLRMQNGTYRWFRSRGQAERAPDGAPLHLAGSIADIGSRKRAEDALRDSQAQFSAIFQTVPVGIGLSTPDDGVAVQVNDELARILGWSVAELIGNNGFAVGAWADATARDEVMRCVRADGRVALHDVPMRHRSGRLLRVDLSVQQIELGGRQLLLSAVTDVTARHAAEQALREQREAYEAIFNAASDAVVSVDERGRILVFNPGAERIFQRSAAAVLGEPVDLLLPAAERAAHGAAMGAFAAWSSPGTGKGTGASRVQGLRSDAQTFELDASISQAMVGGRQVSTAILHDVTEQVRAEADALRHQLELSALTRELMAQEKRTTQRLAQTLHDQLGQTLTALRLVTDLDRRAMPDLPADALQRRAQASELVDQAVKQVRRVLVDLRPPLLDEEGLYAAIDNEVTTRAALHPLTDVLLDADPASQAQRWPAEVEYAMFMIAREALENALQHAQASLVRVALVGRAGSAALQVSDNGVGMPPGADRGRPGHLGLIGMRERAHAIGAQLEIDVPPGGGTRLCLTWATPP